MYNAIVLLLIAFSCCYSQHSILSEAVHPLSQAKAKTGICQWNGYHSAINPALLSGLQNSLISLYSRNYYFTKGISNQSIFLQYKINAFSGGSLIASKDGSVDYTEYLVKIAYGMQLGQHVKMGIGLFGMLLDQYAIKQKIHANIQWGIITKIHSNLLAGCVLTNPLSFKKSSLNVPPFHFTTGINYRIYNGLELLAELQKEGFSALITSIGINYQASLHLQLAVGVRTSGPQLSAGILYALTKKFTMSMAMENHPQLGISLNTGIDYIFYK